MPVPTPIAPDRHPPEAAPGHPSRTGVRRLSVAYFLVAEILLIVVVPFVDQVPAGELIESALTTLVLLSGVMAVGGRRRTFIAAVVLVTPAILGKWLHHVQPDLIPVTFTSLAAVAFVAFVIFHLFRFILRAPRVDNEILGAAVAAYLMLGILWAFGYLLASRLEPQSFHHAGAAERVRPLATFEALFVSFGTLSTVGYDEVRPVSKPARMLAMAQAMTGTFYIALLVARLVAIYSGNEDTRTGRNNDRDST